VVDTIEKTVTRGGVELELSPTECRILEYMDSRIEFSTPDLGDERLARRDAGENCCRVGRNLSRRKAGAGRQPGIDLVSARELPAGMT
jgi:hypothetical protein